MICEGCGLEYEADTCPACTAKAGKSEVDPTSKKKSKLAKRGLKLGIFNMVVLMLNLPITVGSSLLIGPIYLIPAFAVGIVISVIGAVLCAVGKKKAANQTAAKVGLALGIIGAVARIALGIIATILSIVTFIVGAVLGFVFLALFPGI